MNSTDLHFDLSFFLFLVFIERGMYVLFNELRLTKTGLTLSNYPVAIQFYLVQFSFSLIPIFARTLKIPVPYSPVCEPISFVLVQRCDFLRLRNMLLKATFPSSYLGLVEATSAAKKKWVLFGTACYKFMSVKNTPLPQQDIIYSTPFRKAVHVYSLSKRCDHASQKQAQTAQCLANPL